MAIGPGLHMQPGAVIVVLVSNRERGTAMSDHGTPREMPVTGLMFGDRFRFKGDPENVCYAAVKRTQQYGDSHFRVELVDGTNHYSVITRQVVLLHRVPDCACGVHVDLCEADCVWPQELEDLWDSLFRLT